MTEIKKIYVAGFPKSGNTWLTRLLADTLQSPVGAGMSDDDTAEIATDLNLEIRMPEDASYKILKTHDLPADVYERETGNLERVVYIMRDFRDIAISGFFMKNRKYNINECDIHYTRPGKALSRGPLWCIRYYRNSWLLWHYIKSLLTGWGKHKKRYSTWTSHINQWRKFGVGHPGVYIAYVRYEDMLKDPEGVFLGVLNKLNVDIPSLDRVRQGIERQSFENKKKFLNNLSDNVSLHRGKDFNVKFLRKGISGDWKNYLSPWMASQMHAVLGSKLMEEKFETDPEWFVHLSASWK